MFLKILPMIRFGMNFIVTAALLYSTSIWTERIQKKLKRWMVWTFGFGFFCDLIGTSTMMYVLYLTHHFSIHVWCGIFALILMAIHFWWAIKSIRDLEKYQKLFTKWSIVAWSVWILALITGSPLLNIFLK